MISLPLEKLIPADVLEKLRPILQEIGNQNPHTNDYYCLAPDGLATIIWLAREVSRLQQQVGSLTETVQRLNKL